MKSIQSKNIIKKLQVEVNTNSVTKAMQIKDTIDLFIKEEIYPEIEAILNKYSQQTNNHFIQIDAIEIDLNGNNYNDYKSIIKNKLDKSIASQISATKNTLKQSISKEDKTIQAFLFFIENGQLPWWYRSQAFFNIETINSIKNKRKHYQNLVELLRKKAVQKRVIYQFNFDEIEALFLVAFSINLNTDYALYKTIKNRILTQQKFNFWPILFTAAFNKNNPDTTINIFDKIAHILTLENNKNTNSFSIEKSSISAFVSLINYIVILLQLPIGIIKKGQGKIALIINKNADINTTLKQNFNFGKANISEPYITCYYNTRNTLSKNEKEKNTFQPDTESRSIKTEISRQKNALPNSNFHPQKEETQKKNASLNAYYNANTNSFNEKNEPLDILIQKAGLVILHPFLPQLFTTLGFYNKGEKQIHPDKIHAATQVLHFLATKNESPHEYELTFEKFLCGIPINTPIKRLRKIPIEQKEECNSLLHSVINHWSALKTNNTDTLRSGFLIREGKLTKGIDSNKVYVQRQAHDILLERLPWGLSIINLPWMPVLTFIEW